MICGLHSPDSVYSIHLCFHPLPPPPTLSTLFFHLNPLSPHYSLGMTPVASKLTEFSLAKKTDNQNPIIDGMNISPHPTPHSDTDKSTL